MSFSFWEYNHFASRSYIVIVGGGITGISTAISLKQKNKDCEILVIEKFFPPQGASTKNAGFVCFGSPTELLDDLSQMSEEECCEIISMRWQGAQILRQRLMNHGGYSPQEVGGFELYKENEGIHDDQLHMLNALMKKSTGIQDYFLSTSQNQFNGFNAQCISMPHEAQINAMDMMQILYNRAHELKINFLMGHCVSEFDFEKRCLFLENGERLPYHKLAITTNGFTKMLIPNVEVHAARNQVLMTNEIENLTWSGVYHFDKGYYYFRRYGNRILLGGARNKDAQREMTVEFGNTDTILNELNRFLREQILGNGEYKIEKTWSGILGIGPSKYPILEQVHDGVFLGVRLGGMGVAIGSLLGEKLAKKILFG